VAVEEQALTGAWDGRLTLGGGGPDSGLRRAGGGISEGEHRALPEASATPGQDEGLFDGLSGGDKFALLVPDGAPPGGYPTGSGRRVVGHQNGHFMSAGATLKRCRLRGAGFFAEQNACGVDAGLVRGGVGGVVGIGNIRAEGDRNQKPGCAQKRSSLTRFELGTVTRREVTAGVDGDQAIGEKRNLAEVVFARAETDWSAGEDGHGGFAGECFEGFKAGCVGIHGLLLRGLGDAAREREFGEDEQFDAETGGRGGVAQVALEIGVKVGFGACVWAALRRRVLSCRDDSGHG